MPMLHVSMMEGRSDDLKEELVKRLTETVTETLSVRQESVRILVQEYPKRHWGIAGQSVAKRDGVK